MSGQPALAGEPGPPRGPGRRRLAAMLATGLVLVAALPAAAAWVSNSARSTAVVAEQQATFQRATAGGVPPDLVRMFAVAGRSSGTEWEILAAISQVVNDHGRPEGAVTTTTTAAGQTSDLDDAIAEVWPVAATPITRSGEGGQRWVTAMLLRDDETELDPTASLEAAREVGFLLQERLAEMPDHRPDQSFVSQPIVYEQAISMLPLRGLGGGGTTPSAMPVGITPALPGSDGTAPAPDDESSPEPDDESSPEPDDEPSLAVASIGLASTPRSTASRIVNLAIGWRAGEACGGGLGLTPFPTNGPINVGDRLSVDGRVMTPTMMGHAQIIVEVARRHGLGERAMVVAVITALQESGLRMLASRALPASQSFPHDAVVAGDNDSINTFQQRPSMGWGTIAQLMDPVYAAEAFFGVGRGAGRSGLTNVAGWQTLAPTVAAQSVQRSAFPDAYAKWVPDAAGIVESILSADGSGTARVASGDTESTETPTPTGEPGVSSPGPSPDASPFPTRLVAASAGATSPLCAGVLGAWGGATRQLPAPGGAVVVVADLPLPAGGTLTVNAAIATQVAALLDAAAADGIVFGGSGWRSTQQQERLRVLNGCPDVFSAPSSACRVPTARPGSSQHEVGLAVDFTYNGASLCGTPGCRSYPGFAWLQQHAATYGLINLPSEPWHWSTTGR